jgi:hypothetical protein
VAELNDLHVDGVEEEDHARLSVAMLSGRGDARRAATARAAFTHEQAEGPKSIGNDRSTLTGKTAAPTPAGRQQRGPRRWGLGASP